MHKIFTCPKCSRQYTVIRPGVYVCDCGYEYSVSEPAATHSIIPDYVMSSTTKNLKRPSFCTKSIKRYKKEECIFAKASVICGILGIVLCGIFSLPALVLGILAMFAIWNPKNRLSGAATAISGITLAVLGIIVWGYIFVMYLEV